MSTLSWQAGNASGSFLTGTIIQSLIALNYPDTYNPQPYQGTLLVFAMVAVLFIVNIWGADIWPKIQNGLMIFHILGFAIVLIILWVCAPHQTATAVFTEFSNEGGWSSLGLSIMVGQITAIYALLGMSSSNDIKYPLLIETRIRCDRSHCGRGQRCW
jgi:amino acid transporter